MFFGSGSALKAEASITKEKQRGELEIPGIPTVSLSAAREQKYSRRTKYDWDREAVLTLQIGKREITDVIAVLSGYLLYAKFDHHGKQRNKSYSLDRTDNVLNLCLSGPGKQFSFKLAGAQRITLLCLCFRQWQRQQGGLSDTVLHRMLEAAYR